MASFPGRTAPPVAMGTAAVASGAAGRPVKKLVISNFKVPPKLPENFAEDMWSKLQAAIVAIQQQRPTDCSNEELYRACENLCLNNMASMVYTRLVAALESHIKEEQQRVRERTGTDLDTFLGILNATWQRQVQQTIMIRSILLYLDRTYVLQTGQQSIYDVNLNLFRDYIVKEPTVSERLVQGLLSMIERERNGEVIDRASLTALVRMLSTLQLYDTLFQPPFLEASRRYYVAAGDRFQAELDVPDLLLRIEGCLKDEADRVAHYLDASTRKPLIEIVEQNLLQAHNMQIVERGFEPLIDARRLDDLARMFNLFGRINAHDSLRSAFSVYVRRRGTELVTGGEERDKTLVEDLIALRDQMDHVVDVAFQRRTAFQHALKESFESFINIRQNKPAELVAKFLDSKLKMGNKVLSAVGTTEQSDEELEQTLDKALALFRFIHGKDVFEAFYKKDLAKRLLHGKSASTDAEKSMLTKLKTECGSQFTTNLENMFKDIEVSRDIMGAFRQSRAYEQLGRIDLYVNVLTFGSWPAYPVMDVAVPVDMLNALEVFKAFYVSKHSGRRLMWQHSLGSCVLRANFPHWAEREQQGVKELIVSMFQTLVILKFNDSDTWTFEELKQTLNIEDKELRRTLQSLACGKVRVLNKEPKGRDVEDGDRFTYNRDFRNSLVRIKINAIQLKETVEEQQDTTERVFQDRQYQVDAAIVRIMKTRKRLSHTLLMSELFEQLKFPVKPADLKKRIESLIDREYLERDKTNPTIYAYLA